MYAAFLETGTPQENTDRLPEPQAFCIVALMLDSQLKPTQRYVGVEHEAPHVMSEV
jgi:hypothetical protein